MRMAERQSDHRMFLEKFVIPSDSKRADRGQNYGLVVALAMLVVSAFLIYLGHDWAGGVIASLDIVGLVSVFIYGSLNRRSERVQKAELMIPPTKSTPPKDKTAN